MNKFLLTAMSISMASLLFIVALMSIDLLIVGAAVWGILSYFIYALGRTDGVIQAFTAVNAELKAFTRSKFSQEDSES